MKGAARQVAANAEGWLEVIAISPLTGKENRMNRPYTTDYGISKGHCATYENALIAAMKQLLIQRLSHCTIETPDGRSRRLRLSELEAYLKPKRGTVVPLRRVA